MSRINTPPSIDEAPAASRPKLEQVKQMLGTVPNLFRMVANSPAALDGYLGMFGALSGGKLPAATHERIALAVAEANGCDYCLSAHAWLGKNVAKLDDAEMAANRRGTSNWTPAPMPRSRSRARSWSARHVSDAEFAASARRATVMREIDRDRGARGAQHLERLRQQRRAAPRSISRSCRCARSP